MLNCDIRYQFFITCSSVDCNKYHFQKPSLC
nr:MAG TPA: hypothetical protein [Caudoviricetes sp.]